MSGRPRFRFRGLRRIGVGGVVSFITAVGFSGCGQSAGPSTQVWISDADQICDEVQREAAQVRPVLTTPTLIDTLKKSSDLSKKESRQLRDLEKPDAKRDLVRDYVNALDERATAIDAYVIQLNNGPGFGIDMSAGNSGLEKIASATEKAASLAKQLGLLKCLAGIDMAVGGAAGATTPASGVAPGAGANRPTEPVSIPNDPNAVEPETITPSSDGFGTEDGAGEG